VYWESFIFERTYNSNIYLHSPVNREGTNTCKHWSVSITLETVSKVDAPREFTIPYSKSVWKRPSNTHDSNYTNIFWLVSKPKPKKPLFRHLPFGLYCWTPSMDMHLSILFAFYTVLWKLERY